MNELTTLLEAAVRRDPDGAALLHPGGSVTYAELGTMARTVADDAAARGVAPGQLVAIGMANSPALVAALFGIWMAGGVALELPPALAPQDRAEVSERAGAVALVTADDDIGGTRLESLAGDARSPDATLACINLTSGTTGASKGVMLTDRNLRRNAELFVEHVGLEPNDRTCLPLPLQFGMNKIALLANLLVGATVVLEPGAAVPNRLLEVMGEREATGLVAVPALARSLVRYGDVERFPVLSLRNVRIGAGRIDERLIADLRTAFPDARVVLTYGLTEIGLVAAMSDEDHRGHPAACGKPIPEVGVEVDADGEILVTCDHAAVGYWRDEAATARTFADGRVRTGDVGRIEDGFLYLTGRRTGIIKTAGENVAPEDVEAALLRHPGVEDCAVIGVPDEWLGEAIVAFVVPVAGSGVNESALKAHALAELPAIARPQRFVLLDDLPRGPSGKIRKAELAPLTGSEPSHGTVT